MAQPIDESLFMDGLLQDLDESFWNAVPTPDPSPVKFNARASKALPGKIDQPNFQPNRDPKPHHAEIELDLHAVAKQWNVRSLNNSISGESSLVPDSQEDVDLKVTRCIVESVSESNGSGFAKELIVQVEGTNERRRVKLTHEWVQTNVQSGDVVNVLGTFIPLPSTSASCALTSSITISSKENYLILHPDVLITATALANSAQCRRKPVLSSMVRSASDTNPSMLWGTILHEVTQLCLRERRWDEPWISAQIDKSIQENLINLVKNNVSIEQAQREVKMRSRGLQTFFTRYMADEPKADAILTNTRSTSAPSLLAISNLIDIEEDIWSPKYGIKGKVDATVHGIISDPEVISSDANLCSRNTVSGPLPLELKTGLSSGAMEHRAQTMLYTLLLSERYGVDVSSGLLFYTQKEEVVRVPRSRNEVRGLLTTRNDIASFLTARIKNEDQSLRSENTPDVPFLPPTIDDERRCQRCFTLNTCMLYRKAVEGVEDTQSPIASVYAHHTSHLIPAHQAFFKKWEALISMEETDLSRFRKELWTLGAVEREKHGRCFSDMHLDELFQSPVSVDTPTKESHIHRYTYQFMKSSAGSEVRLLNGHISVGDAVTVSVEPHLLALTRGFVTQLTQNTVTLGVDHEISLKNIRSLLELRHIPVGRVIFRIDKDELFAGMGRIRDNLAQLFYVDANRRHLELVVDLAPPVFDPHHGHLDALATPQYSRFLENLNPHQRQAIEKALAAHDYSLILGMPGTGKTTVIAALIKLLVQLGKTVLLTSHTHSAVDTILHKLHDAEFSILRLGNLDKIHPDVQKYTLAARKSATQIEHLEQQLMSPPVVATTCLSVDHALFSRRRFDYCIVDEASQITLPTCLGPLRYADTFILVGDHFQLPPLVRSTSARKGGFDVSLFRRLSDAHPEMVVHLAYQYRMNEDIMLLSNKLIYGNRLQCGNDTVANQFLNIPNRTPLIGLHGGKLACHQNGCWISKLLAPRRRAVFVDTDDLPAHDSRVGNLVQNETEALLVSQLVGILTQCGIRQQQIGIITLYRQQIKLLAHSLQPYSGIEILTADRSQGRDKDCIIISMVRSNDAAQVGDLLRDWRRINVSFTRARSKLIIIGSRKTLQSVSLLEDFFNLMAENNWILRLPSGATSYHPHLSRGVSAGSAMKRPAEDTSNLAQTKSKERPAKKMKKIVAADLGTLKNRPILIDLVNDDL